jgi:hypothetical protein
MRHDWVIIFLFQGSLAMPRLLTTRADEKFEWTSLGDSYASGVGSANYVDGRRCLRYDQAYPVQLSGDPDLAEGDYIFNNVVCSGAHYDDVENYQFYDEDTSGQPSWQYSMLVLGSKQPRSNTHISSGPRPKFGNPQMATLAVGGDDIDFPGILFNCVLDAHILGGPPQRTCDEQRQYSWSLINSPDLANNIDHLIQKTVTRGRKGSIGEKFKLYVTGYGEFFNEVDQGCDTVTFARTANPTPDGRDHTKMTTDLRKDFNHMSLALNAAIQDAVQRNKGNGVKFIDIQGNNALDSHRFCEPGVQEPDQRNENLWFWHYPYNEPQNDNTKLMQDASDTVSQRLSTADLSAKFVTTADYTNAIFDAVDYAKAQKVNGGDVEARGLWDAIGFRAKVFHPQVPFHTHIKDLVIAQYKRDLADENAASKPSAPDNNACHGVGGDTWVMHKDQAVENVGNFCAQGSKSVE